MESRIMAFQGFITVVGERQGQFKGESTDANKPGPIPIFNFENGVSLPFDQATGSPTGTHVRDPVVLIKKIGAASPQFYRSLVTNETLTTVSVTFNQPNAAGTLAPFFTIVLTNASVVRIRQSVTVAPGLTDSANPLEEISLTYRKIELSDIDAATSATDEWASG
jgi:type VI secretion system secreted protein Hcp